MKHSYVSAIDGIPGIMPGTKSLLPPLPIEPEDEKKIFDDELNADRCNTFLEQKGCILPGNPKKSE